MQFRSGLELCQAVRRISYPLPRSKLQSPDIELAALSMLNVLSCGYPRERRINHEITPPAITKPGRMSKSDIAITNNQKLLGRINERVIVFGAVKLISFSCPAAQSTVFKNKSPFAYWLKNASDAKSTSP